MDTSILRILLFAVGLAALGGTAFGQEEASTSDDGCITLRITDLTCEERDALSREFSNSTSARILFACVPAGLIILGPAEESHSTASLRLRAMPGLLRNVAPGRITEDHLTLEHAEELCAEERTQ